MAESAALDRRQGVAGSGLFGRGKTVRLAMAALASFALAASAARTAAAEGGLDRVVAAGTLAVAVVPRAPWAMRDSSGAWKGHDIALVNALAADLGVTPRFVEMRADELAARLPREADLAVGGLMIRSDLARQLVYSDPVGFSVVRAVAVRKPVQLFDARTRLAVEAGSVAEVVARDTFPNATLLSLPSGERAASAFLHGEADAMVAASPVPRLLAATFDSHARLVGPALARTAEAVAMRPEDLRLQAYVNNWIAARVADGWLRDLRHHWFVSFAWVEDHPNARSKR
jgi:ABC-type amino acid transport substrate-binding protein